MAMPPLTHHDIINYSQALTARGSKVDLASSDRAERYIQFHSQLSEVRDSSLTYSLQVGRGNVTQVTRVLAHISGLVSTLTAIVTNIDAVLDVFENVPMARQLDVHNDHVVARSYSLDQQRGSAMSASSLVLRFVCARVAGIELRVDTSTGSAMPADVRIMIIGQQTDYLRELLADGEDSPLLHRAARRQIGDATSTITSNEARLVAQVLPAEASTSAPGLSGSTQQTSVQRIPDDLLATLGPQWRPLVNQGDHWKGVLRQLGQGVRRTQRAENWIQDALVHLHRTLTQAPERYHTQHHQARWRVYVRRLQPVMLFIAILALMPISWLFVSGGDVQMHPLALGLTPLLMVGVVALTAREIPVMEIPPKPAPLGKGYWQLTGESHHNQSSKA